MVEDIIENENDLMENSKGKLIMDIESEDDSFQKKFQDGMLGSGSASSRSRKKNGLMPPSYKEYFFKYTYSMRQDFTSLKLPTIE